MPREIERQYVVDTEHPEYIALISTLKGKRYIQSRIQKIENGKLRIRIIEDLLTWEQTATIAFKVNKKTIYTDPNVRHEYEWSIPPREALYMMLRHADISKIRYVYTDIHNHIWEIDVYENKNIGVVTADVELTNIREKIILPAWIGREVTKDKKITNNALAKTPYATWTPQEQAWYQTLKKR